MANDVDKVAVAQQPSVPEGRERVAAANAFQGDAKRLKALREGQGEVLEVAIELVAPVVEAGTETLAEIVARRTVAPELEAVFGAAAEASRKLEVFAQRAMLIAGGERCVGEFEGFATGPVICDELYLLASGELAHVTSLGTWSKAGEDTVVKATVVSARAISADEAVQHFDWEQMLVRMGGACRPGSPAPDAADRLERLSALVARVAVAAAGGLSVLRAALRS